MLFNKNTASYIINTHFIMEITKKLKPFDLEAAKAGTPVMTRDGCPARILAFDVENAGYPVVAAIKTSTGECERIELFTEQGQFDEDTKEDNRDLFMVSVKHRAWANVHKNNGYYTLTGCHDTEEIARWCGHLCSTYITTVPIEWEE